MPRAKRIIIAVSIGLITAFMATLVHQQSYKEKRTTLHDVTAVVNTENDHFRDEVASILATRISDLTRDFKITHTNEDDDLIIEAGAIYDTAVFKRILTESAEMRFSEMYTMLEVMAAFQEIIAKDEKARALNTKKAVTTDSSKLSQYLSPDTLLHHEKMLSDVLQLYSDVAIGGENYYQSVIGHLHSRDRDTLVRILEKYQQHFPQDIEFAFGRPFDGKENSDQEKMLELYCLKKNTGYGINRDRLRSAEESFDHITARPVIALEFDREGAVRWEGMTRANVNKPIAILINNEVVTAPTVIEPISGGKSIISGNFTLPEVTQLSVLLKSSPLPTTVNIVDFQADQKTKITWRSAIFFFVTAALANWLIGLLKPSKSIDS